MNPLVSLRIELAAQERDTICAAAAALEVSVSDYVRGLTLPDARAVTGTPAVPETEPPARAQRTAGR